MRPPVAEERQRQSRDRHDPEGHPDVDEHLHQQDARDPGRDDHRVAVHRLGGDDDRAPQQDGEQREHARRTHEAELLADDGEDEVGVVVGHVGEGGLRALKEPATVGATDPMAIVDWRVWNSAPCRSASGAPAPRKTVRRCSW